MIKVKGLSPVEDINVPEVVLRGTQQKDQKELEADTAQTKSSVLASVTNTESIAKRDQEMVGIDGLIGKKQNIVIESYGEDGAFRDCITRLAALLVKEDPLMKGFIRRLRSHYINKMKPFSFSIAGWKEEEKKKLREIFSEELCGVVDSIDVESNPDVISGNIVFSPSAQLFITGQYMEIGVYEIVKEVMREIAAYCKITWKIYRNVKVQTKNGCTKNEFDIVIEREGMFYVIEVKSGKEFKAWGDLVDIGKEYEIVPDRLLLVDSWLSDEKAGCIEELCRYYVSNLANDTLRKKIITMITNDL